MRNRFFRKLVCNSRVFAWLMGALLIMDTVSNNNCRAICHRIKRCGIHAFAKQLEPALNMNTCLLTAFGSARIFSRNREWRRFWRILLRFARTPLGDAVAPQPARGPCQPLFSVAAPATRNLSALELLLPPVKVVEVFACHIGFISKEYADSPVVSHRRCSDLRRQTDADDPVTSRWTH